MANMNRQIELSALRRMRTPAGMAGEKWSDNARPGVVGRRDDETELTRTR